jgi:hypothetical protein
MKHLIVFLAALAMAAPAVAQRDETADRAEIHALLTAYGTTIDARDFDGFSALFAKDGFYSSGDEQGVPGSEAGEWMRQIFAENALGFAEPNFHIFFNEVVTFDGPDTAHSTSMALYMVPGEDGAPKAALMAGYEDELVREDGVWKFQRRQVNSLIP